MTVQVPSPRPCVSCPYRRDVPSGVWDESEYAKLPDFDRETGMQPPSVFVCHQQDGRMCAGWAGCHDMEESLGLRLALSFDLITPAEYEAVLDYTTDVPLFGSGQEAADHGREMIEHPPPEAVKLGTKIIRRRVR